MHHISEHHEDGFRSKLTRHLNEKIKGQEFAAKTFANAVARGHADLTKSGRPKGVLLLMGPTGVGKTEMTLEVCRYIYHKDGEERIARFDMAEYQTQESISLLRGSDVSDQGPKGRGLLGTAIDRINASGGGLILFDEIEKANKELVKIFLSAMDAARMTMANGEIKDLSNIYLIFTSNLGCEDAIKMQKVPYSTLKRRLIDAARQFFAPELLARFEEVVVFNHLNFETQILVCQKFLDIEIAHLEKKVGRKIVVEKMVFDYLKRKGYLREEGARPMRKTVEMEMRNAIVGWQEASGAQWPEAENILVMVAPSGDRLVHKPRGMAVHTAPVTNIFAGT